jgi:ribosomal protein S18 acetylase RimI-like enzyme
MEQLAAAYNEARVDYIVPMPLTVNRLRHYINIYDVDLARSCAAVERIGNQEKILGLGMLGVRTGRGWITRLGVLPSGRRRGIGRSIMEHLLRGAAECAVSVTWLDVIKGNTPAHELFLNLGFIETRELIVARRPPDYQAQSARTGRGHVHNVRTYNREGALALLEQRRGRPSWLNEIESFRKAGDLSAISLATTQGGRGWVAFQVSLLRLTRIVVEVIVGDPAGVCAALLHTLHSYYPTQDAISENVPADDPVWPGYLQAGYIESFRRIEMVREI